MRRGWGRCTRRPHASASFLLPPCHPVFGSQPFASRAPPLHILPTAPRSTWRKLNDAGKSTKEIADIAQLRVVLTPRPTAAAASAAPTNGAYANGASNGAAAASNGSAGRGFAAVGAPPALDYGSEKQLCYHVMGLVHTFWAPIPGEPRLLSGPCQPPPIICMLVCACPPAFTAAPLPALNTQLAYTTCGSRACNSPSLAAPPGRQRRAVLPAYLHTAPSPLQAA